MSYRDRLAFPGEQMMRLSMDPLHRNGGMPAGRRLRPRRSVRRAAVPPAAAHAGRPHDSAPPGVVMQENRCPTKGRCHEPVDLQSMETPKEEAMGDVETGSRASLLLCGDSSLSVTTCN
ncbi:hypothetical protein GCM10023238_03630 [Streptomyces heliomycini]